MHYELQDLEPIAWAARFRVACWEDGLNGGLRPTARAAELQEWVRECEWPLRPVRWRDWLQRSTAVALSEAVDHFAARGCSRARLEAELAGPVPRPWPREVEEKVRRRWQRSAVLKLRCRWPAWAANRARHRLARWGLPILPRLLLPYCRAALQALRPLVPPRVLAAVWRSWWNGWLTTRRMRSCTGWTAPARCILGCPRGDDSLEHYGRCPLVAAWALRDLGLRPPAAADAMGDFLLLTPRPCRDAEGRLPRRALRLAATYRVHCLVRHGTVPTGPAAVEALRQASRDLVRGHVVAGAALDSEEHRWAELAAARAAAAAAPAPPPPPAAGAGVGAG